MAKASITLGKGWRVFQKALDPKIQQPILEKHVGRATRANAIVARKRVRQHIRKGAPTREGFVGVAPLTALIKGGDKPIVGTPGADLFNSIAYEVQDWKIAIVGVARTEGGHNIGKIVHDGLVLKVTPKMRGLFWLLWLVSQGRVDAGRLRGRAFELYHLTKGAKGIKPISKAKTAIVIPSRPFIKDVVEDEETKKILRENWRNAVKATLAEQAKKGEAI